MVVQNDEECKNLIEKLGNGLSGGNLSTSTRFIFYPPKIQAVIKVQKH